MKNRRRAQTDLDPLVVALWMTGMSVCLIARTLDIARVRVRCAIERWRARPTADAPVVEEDRKT